MHERAIFCTKDLASIRVTFMQDFIRSLFTFYGYHYMTYLFNLAHIFFRIAFSLLTYIVGVAFNIWTQVFTLRKRKRNKSKNKILLFRKSYCSRNKELTYNNFKCILGRIHLKKRIEGHTINKTLLHVHIDIWNIF